MSFLLNLEVFRGVLSPSPTEAEPELVSCVILRV